MSFEEHFAQLSVFFAVISCITAQNNTDEIGNWETYLAAKHNDTLGLNLFFSSKQECNQSNNIVATVRQCCPSALHQENALLITARIIVHFTLLTNFVQYLLQCNDKKFPSMGRKKCNETTLCIAVQSTTPRVKLSKVHGLVFGFHPCVSCFTKCFVLYVERTGLHMLWQGSSPDPKGVETNANQVQFKYLFYLQMQIPMLKGSDENLPQNPLRR